MTKNNPINIILPASKSISQRALIISKLINNDMEINNLSDSNDVRVLLNALNSSETEINIGANGTAMRFMTAYLSQINENHILTGNERMLQRPIKILVEALISLGAKISYLGENGFPPLKIEGKRLAGGEISIDGSVSSQYVSALMLIAPLMNNGLIINLLNQTVSQPYILMTAKIMKHFGAEVHFFDNKIKIAPQNYKSAKLEIEADWSASSYWYELAAATGKSFILPNLFCESWQGDRITAELFSRFGVQTEFAGNATKIFPQKTDLNFFEFDFTNYPDLVQTAIATCLLKNVPFRCVVSENLRIKETDRISAIISESQKLGFELFFDGKNILQWNGKQKKNIAQHIDIETFNDHRMAMAFAPFTLFYDIKIKNTEVVSKSYPNFWDEFAKI